MWIKENRVLSRICINQKHFTPNVVNVSHTDRHSLLIMNDYCWGGIHLVVDISRKIIDRKDQFSRVGFLVGNW